MHGALPAFGSARTAVHVCRDPMMTNKSVIGLTLFASKFPAAFVCVMKEGDSDVFET